MQSTYTINIAGLAIDVYIENGFKNVKDFIGVFRIENVKHQDTKIKINFLKGTNRKLELSKDWESLSISGDIDDLLDPFNLIGITQAVFRFAAIHLGKRNIFLLHGSAAVLDNQIVYFGDDGSSIAKTLGSLEIALESKLYVADEFCFFDAQNQKVSGYPFIPIHIRPIVKEHLKSKHNLIVPKDNYKETEAGEFIKLEKLFKIASGKLNILSYIHFSNGGPSIEVLSQEEAYKSFKFCITSHIAKLLYPELDRMQFMAMSDANILKSIDEVLVDNIFKKITKNGINPKILKNLMSYKLIVSEPCQIIPLLRAKIL